MFKETNYQKA